MGVDKQGVDEMGVDEMGSRRSGMTPMKLNSNVFEPHPQSMNNYFDPTVGLSRRWHKNLQLLKATIHIFSMYCRQILVAFGNLITTSTESRLHFEELCFLKAALTSFQFDNPLIIDTLSS